MDDLEGRWKDGIEDRLKKAERKIDKLDGWMTWMLGAGFIIGLIVTAFGKHLSAVVFGS